MEGFPQTSLQRLLQPHVPSLEVPSCHLGCSFPQVPPGQILTPLPSNIGLPGEKRGVSGRRGRPPQAKSQGLHIGGLLSSPIFPTIHVPHAVWGYLGAVTPSSCLSHSLCPPEGNLPAQPLRQQPAPNLPLTAPHPSSDLWPQEKGEQWAPFSSLQRSSGL